MRKYTTSFLAWIIMAVAILAWAGTGMFALTIGKQQATRASRASDMEGASQRDSASGRLHALARETQDLRGQLNSVGQIDVLGMANVIEGVGKITGVKMRIVNAVPDAVPQSTKANANANASALYGIGFQVAVQGSYAALMQTIALLETLPLLSSVDSVDLEEIDSSGKTNQWILAVRIHVFSVTPISS